LAGSDVTFPFTVTFRCNVSQWVMLHSGGGLCHVSTHLPTWYRKAAPHFVVTEHYRLFFEPFFKAIVQCNNCTFVVTLLCNLVHWSV